MAVINRTPSNGIILRFGGLFLVSLSVLAALLILFVMPAGYTLVTGLELAASGLLFVFGGVIFLVGRRFP